MTIFVCLLSLITERLRKKVFVCFLGEKDAALSFLCVVFARSGLSFAARFLLDDLRQLVVQDGVLQRLSTVNVL